VKRKRICSVVGGGLLGLTLSAFAQGKAADVPTFPHGTEVVTVPYSHPVDFGHLNSLHVRMSLNGSAPQSFDVDTGSVGIVVGAVSIPNFDGKGEPGELTYSSSGVHEKGVWTTVEITFPDVKMPDGRPVVAHVPVLAVTSMDCTGKGVNAAHCSVSASAPDPHMLGIGFGRAQATSFDAQRKNTFVQLDDMVKGKMRRGYMITPAGIQLGLNAESLGNGWAWQKLAERDVKMPEDYTGPKDWTTAPGTFSVAGKVMPMGAVLIDTGLTNMMIEAPGAPQEGDVTAGTPVTIYLLGGQFRYSFQVDDVTNPTTPRKTSWRDAKHGTFVNTGLHALTLFDYCFDSDGGYLGLRKRE
jgi:hypothetical protein